MLRLFGSLIGYAFLFGAALFGPSHTLRWRAAWVLLGVLFVADAMNGVLLHRKSPSLLNERTRFPLQRGQPLIDRILLPSFMASYAALVAFISWDRFHRTLLGTLPPWLRAIGLVVFIAGWIVVHFALRANSFAVTVVRHQPERGHTVVSAGPYGIVRHPMYAGLVLVIVGLAVWLGSTAGVVGSMVPIGVLVVRSLVEERLLRRSLPTYARYASEVHWRLVPGVW